MRSRHTFAGELRKLNLKKQQTDPQNTAYPHPEIIQGNRIEVPTCAAMCVNVRTLYKRKGASLQPPRTVGLRSSRGLIQRQRQRPGRRVRWGQGDD
jgi:hypothetical protein